MTPDVSAAYQCSACDEGMYLYPVEAVNQRTTPSSNYITNYCVPDCPSVNFQMVNNPELGRCEFLGYYCLYGNKVDGCKKTYGSKIDLLMTPLGIFQLQSRTQSGLGPTYGTPQGVIVDSF